MASFCAELKSEDIHAFNLCRAREKAGDSLVDLDQGTDRLSFNDPGRPERTVKGQGDDKLTPQEIYHRFLTLILQEENQRSAKFLKNIKKTPAFSPDLLKAMSSGGKFSVPFVFDDLNAKTDADEKLFKTCLQAVQKIQKKLAKEKLKVDSADYKKRLGEEIFDFIKGPAKKGGLGIQFARDAERADRDFAGMVAAGEATCLEFVLLYLALARMAGLEATPVEVFRDAKGYLNEHVRIAVRPDPKDPKKVLFFDIADGLAGERTGELWTEISQLDLWAYYYNDAYIGATELKEKEGFLQKALQFSPYQYMVLSNYGHWILENGGKLEKALGFFLQACETNPQYPFIFRGLAKVYEAQGKTKKANIARKRAEELFEPRPLTN